MPKGRQEGEVLWHRLADCPLCRLSLGAACSRVLSHRPARLYWLHFLPRSRLYHSGYCISAQKYLHQLRKTSSEPGRGSSQANFSCLSPKLMSSAAIGLQCCSPPRGSVQCKLCLTPLSAARSASPALRAPFPVAVTREQGRSHQSPQTDAKSSLRLWPTYWNKLVFNGQERGRKLVGCARNRITACRLNFVMTFSLKYYLGFLQKCLH